MKALVKKKPEPGVWLEDVPEPDVGRDEVLIRIYKTAICGTDVHIYNWDAWAQKTIPVPMHFGHEFVGKVVETGHPARVCLTDNRRCIAVRWRDAEDGSPRGKVLEELAGDDPLWIRNVICRQKQHLCSGLRTKRLGVRNEALASHAFLKTIAMNELINRLVRVADQLDTK